MGIIGYRLFYGNNTAQMVSPHPNHETMPLFPQVKRPLRSSSNGNLEFVSIQNFL